MNNNDRLPTPARADHALQKKTPLRVPGIIWTVVTVLIGSPIWFVVRDYQQQQLNQALVDAVWLVNNRYVKSLLDQGADPNAREPPWQHISLAEVLSRLLSRGQHQSSADMTRRSALQLILMENWPVAQDARLSACDDIAASLIEHGADTHVPIDNFASPLDSATYWNLHRTVGVLLSRGAAVDIRDRVGNTPLTKADGIDTDLLLQHGADPNAKNKNGWTVLMSACHNGRSDSVRLLINSGATPNAQDKDGKTALMVAKTAEVAVLLLQHKANLNLRDRMGHTALFYARLLHGTNLAGRDDIWNTVPFGTQQNDDYSRKQLIQVLQAHGAFE